MTDCHFFTIFAKRISYNFLSNSKNQGVLSYDIIYIKKKSSSISKVVLKCGKREKKEEKILILKDK